MFSACQDGADDLPREVHLELAVHLRELQVEAAPVPVLLRGRGSGEPPRAQQPREPAGLGTTTATSVRPKALFHVSRLSEGPVFDVIRVNSLVATWRLTILNWLLSKEAFWCSRLSSFLSSSSHISCRYFLNLYTLFFLNYC